MQAIVIIQFGDPKLLKVEEVPTPSPGDEEVLVEVQAAAKRAGEVSFDREPRAITDASNITYCNLRSSF